MIGRFASVTAISMPAGSSVTVGGFDGEVHAECGNGWVSSGRSVWELSVQSNPKYKANQDYQKRTAGVPLSERRNITYVAVTGRKWKKRDEWINEKKAQGEWKAVRAFDADDLEAWLEQDTATQVWFASIIGVPSGALKSPEIYWRDWNRDVVPPIGTEAVLASREKELLHLLKLFEERQSGGTIVIHADSSEEAVAFACATIITKTEDPQLKSIVVEDASGWAAIVASSNVEVAIASETSVAASVPSKEGLVLVVPVATGDSEAHFPGHRGLDIDPDICLQRTFPEAFRDALAAMGIERSDAERLAMQCGRSWSVYRRLKNTNPAQKQPTWAVERFAPVLTAIALVGAYSKDHEADHKVLEQIADVPFVELSRQVEKLVRTDDAPIVQMSGVVKAKSPLELFKLNEAGVTSAQFDKFLKACSVVLGQIDPAFELPKDDRWLANVEGNVRQQSSALFQAMADALPRIATLASDESWQRKIAELVNSLTVKVSGKQWLAVSSVLRPLAEAAPDEFLDALEEDLRDDAPSVFALFEETTSGGLRGECVYADLLWALESLAWAPSRVVRVSRVLAELTRAPKQGNWGNSPAASLLNIYRGWAPQTSATVRMRNRAIFALSASHPKETFELTMGILHRGLDAASPSHRPSWRDDDVGRAQAVSNEDYAEVMNYAAELSFTLAGTSAECAVELFERFDIFDEPNRRRVLLTINSSLLNADPTDVREIRRKLRQKLHWELNFGEGKAGGLSVADLAAVRAVYDQSQPTELIEKHQWLFENYYCELPEKEVRRTSKAAQERVKELRAGAIQEIFDKLRFKGIEELDNAAQPNSCVGVCLRDLRVPKDDMFRWVAGKFVLGNCPTFLKDWLHSFSDEQAEEVLREFLMIGGEEFMWTDLAVTEFLSSVRCEPTTWQLVEEHSVDIRKSYWENLTCLPHWLGKEPRKQGIAKLLEFGNVSAALRSLRHNEPDIDGMDAAEILELNFSSEQNALAELDFHDVRSLVETIEESTSLDRQRLLSLEFQMIAAFGQFAAEVMVELQRELVEDPKQMLFVISKAYRADEGEEVELDEQEANAARVCSHLIFYTNLVPGIQRDGVLSDEKFHVYVEELLLLALAEGFEKGTQIVLGKLLAYAPEVEDGKWPPRCVCEILDKPDHEIMRRTFKTGVYNRRGVTSRLPYDGGGQERDLASKFRVNAEHSQIEFPLVSKTLAEIAASYQQDALRNDRSAEISKDHY